MFVSNPVRDEVTCDSTRFDFDLFTTQHWVLTVLLHNSWFWPVYYTTFDFDIFTQHLILTFLLHNIWFRPFYYITLGFGHFTTPDSILTCLLHNIWSWPFYYTTLCRTVYHKTCCGTTVYQKTPVYYTKFGLDLFTTQLCVGQCSTFVVRQCTTKPNFAVRCTEILNIKNRVNVYLLWVYHRPYPEERGSILGWTCVNNEKDFSQIKTENNQERTDKKRKDWPALDEVKGGEAAEGGPDDDVARDRPEEEVTFWVCKFTIE